MRVRRLPDAVGSYTRRFGIRHRTAYPLITGILAVVPAPCHIDWALIASIGRIESNHARGGYVDAAGTTREPILGPQLNGQGGFAAIPDTDQGLLDTDPVWDRAVGPTQFIPATWKGSPHCWPGWPSRRSSTSTRCCARCTDTPSRAPPTATPRSPASRCCAKASPRQPPRSAPHSPRR